MKNATISLLITFLLSLFAMTTAQAEETYFSWLFSIKRMKEVAPVTDKTYLEECGSCHFAYPPGLLPERSWKKLMSAQALEDHFKENAELDEDTRIQILAILSNHSAEKSYYKRSKKVMSTLGDDVTPLRITEVPYIKEKHHQVDEDIDVKTSKVKSFSNCDKCHQEADNAIFDDDTVMIPGHGYWTW